MSSYQFHPAVDAWFLRQFDGPTEVQAASNTLVSAPTGSGKTLAAFLAAIDGLQRGCTIVDTGHARDRDLAIELADSPLEAVSAHHGSLAKEHPLDVLAQQIIAEVSARAWDEQDLYRAFKCAHPYNHLDEQDFIEVVKMLSEGVHTRSF